MHAQRRAAGGLSRRSLSPRSARRHGSSVVRASSAGNDDKNSETELPPSYPLIGDFQLAESTCALVGVLETFFPDMVMAALLPDDPSLPSFALASGGVALRVDGAMLLVLAAIYNCLADACEKGNYGKSDTYTRLFTVSVVLPVAIATTLALTYGLSENMGSPSLALLFSGALGPSLKASYTALQSRVITPERMQGTAQADAAVLQGWTSPSAFKLEQPLGLFYQSQVILGLMVGLLLIVLPAAIVESPEPSYTAETLCRRISGLEASLALATVSFTLKGAAERGRLGGSTFRTLNLAMGLSTMLIGFWLAWLITKCTDTTLLQASPAFLLVGLAPGSVYAYQGLFAKK